MGFTDERTISFVVSDDDDEEGDIPSNLQRIADFDDEEKLDSEKCSM